MSKYPGGNQLVAVRSHHDPVAYAQTGHGGKRGLLRWVLGSRPNSGIQEITESLAEYLNRGDSRAAVVVSVAPLVVARGHHRG